MKKIFFTTSLLFLALFTSASDLTFSVISATSGFSDGSINLTVSGGVAPYTYSWSGPSGYTASTEDITGLATGTYTVTVTDLYCGIATYTVFVDVAMGITEKNNASLSVYPNPGADEITISSSVILYNASFKMVDLSGKVAVEKINLSGNSVSIDVSKQPSGIYFIEINNNGTLLRKKFVKE